jgi:hypothetical protein
VLGDGAAGGGGAGQATEAAEARGAAAEEGHAADAAGAGEAEARGEPAAAGEGEPRHAAAGDAAAREAAAGHSAAEAVEGREGLRLHSWVVLLLVRRLDVPRLGGRRRHGQDQQGRRRHHLGRPRHRCCSPPLLAPRWTGDVRVAFSLLLLLWECKDGVRRGRWRGGCFIAGVAVRGH